MGAITASFDNRINNLIALQTAFNEKDHITDWYPILKAAEKETENLLNDIRQMLNTSSMHDNFIRVTLEKFNSKKKEKHVRRRC